jgi:hypothetical protein
MNVNLIFKFKMLKPVLLKTYPRKNAYYLKFYLIPASTRKVWLSFHRYDVISVCNWNFYETDIVTQSNGDDPAI